MSEHEVEVETTSVGERPEPVKAQHPSPGVAVEMTAEAEEAVKKRKPFNLKDHDYVAASEQGMWMDLVDENDGRPVGAQIFVFGPDSENVRAARNEFASKLNVTQFRKTRRKQNYDDVVEGNIILALGAAGGWRVRDDRGEWIYRMPWGDEMLEFSRKNARRVFEEHEWIAEQTVEFMEDRGNFLHR